MPDNINLTSLGKASYPELKTPAHFHQDHARAAAELITDGSIEFSGGETEQIGPVADLLPFGTPVFVPVLPLHTMASRLAVIEALHERGFDPVPHIAARRIPARTELAEFLAGATGAGVHRVLLIGGDSRKQAGPFEDSAAVLRDGVLAEAGITEVGLAGYPEGHPRIGAATMHKVLMDKLTLAEEQGLGAQVVTQFSFVPSRIIEFCSWLAARAPGVPIYVGMAGPASLRALVHYARYCGVSASLSAVKEVGVKVAQLVDHRRADEQLGRLASYNAGHGDSNIVGVHLFSFGGFAETARWMHDHLNA